MMPDRDDLAPLPPLDDAATATDDTPMADILVRREKTEKPAEPKLRSNN